MRSTASLSRGAASVVHVAATYPPDVCGIGDYTHLLTRALADAGVPAEVWTRTGARADEGVRVVAERWDAAGVRSLLREVRARRPRLIHFQFETAVWKQNPRLNLLLPLAAKRAGARFVSTLHSLDGPPAWGRASRAALLPLLLGSDSVIVCSERQRRALAHLPGGLGKRVTLVPVGTAIVPVGERPAMRAPGPLRFVYFGFVWRGRNIETLLRALAAVPDAAATLDIVGGIRDAAYHDELVALAQNLNVVGRVRFRGDLPADDVSRALHAADVALLPFATGASTGRTTLMAAFAHGLPVVTMAAPDNLSPLFKPGENLLVSSPEEEGAFVKNVMAAAQNDALRARLADGSVALARAFAWPEIARQTLALPAYQRAAVGVRLAAVPAAEGVVR